MKISKILSPTQIVGGSFWGGPIAAVFYLRRNYLVLGKEDFAQKTLVFGGLFIVLLLGILPFIPEQFPKFIIPALYCLSARQIATTTQLEKEQIEQSEEYTFESNWKIFGVGALTLVLFLVVAILIMFALDYFGLTSIA